MLTNWIRIYNYIEDFFKLIYDIYGTAYIASYPVTYYSIDMKNSVLDNDELLSGSYEKGGVGPLSGVRWKKIYMLPIYSVDQVRMDYQSSDRGIIYEPSSQFILPSLYGIQPLENDVVDLSYGYLKPHQLDEVKMLYSVTSVNLAHQSDYFQLYLINLKNSPFDKYQIDKQVSGHYQFYDLAKKILPASNAIKLLDLQNKIVFMSKTVNLLFDRCGFYLQKSLNN